MFGLEAQAERSRRVDSLYGDTVKKCTLCDSRGFILRKGKAKSCECLKIFDLCKKMLDAEIPDSYWNLEIDDYNGDKAALLRVNKYVGSLNEMFKKGRGILFSGGSGTGKTMLSCALLKEALRSNFTIFFSTFAHLITCFARSWKDSSFARVIDFQFRYPDFLVIDDIGKEYDARRGLTEALLDDVFRTRIYSNKPTIITTNYTIDDLKNRYGESIFSLMCESLMLIEIAGDDFRRRKK